MAAKTTPPADLNILEGFDKRPNGAFVNVLVVAALLDVTPTTIWRWAKKGAIPAPRKITNGHTVWNVGELRAALGGAA